MSLDKLHIYYTHYKHLPIMAACVLLVIFSTTNASAMQNPFLSVHESRHGDLSSFNKWTSLMPRYASQKLATNKCVGDDCPSAQWEGMLAEQKSKSPREQLEAVNNFFNAVNYVEDSANYGKDDYWATPYEFMKNGGDCEDYAIAKYISLKRLGIAENAMRIMILEDQNLGGIMHAVLEVRINGKRYLLDNQTRSVNEVGSIFHYRPIYSINRSGWWTYS